MFYADYPQMKEDIPGIFLTLKHKAMKKILVPFDCSKMAINAFRFALDVTSQSKGKICLLNVMELPVIDEPITMPPFPFEQGFFKRPTQ